MRKAVTGAFVLLFIFMLGVPAHAAPFVMTLSAKANIFGAGLTNVPFLSADVPGDPSIAGSGPGIRPTAIVVAPTPNLYLTFPSVTGTIYFNGSAATGHGADGIYWEDLDTNIDPVNGISGIRRQNSVLFMVGVFLGASGQPLTPPATLDATNADYTASFHPLLGQTFFIGNGLTASGAVQRFYAPEGATRLYLGFADGWNFTGNARWFDDNWGSLTLTVDSGIGGGGSGTPEPATFAMLAGGLGLVCLRWRRFRKN